MYKDLSGMRFGKLTVIKRSYVDRHRKIHWECRCDCGNIIYPATDNLKSGNTFRCKTCGARSACNDLSGNKFGKLTLVKIFSYNPIKYECKCDCGNTKIIRASDILSGKSRSCGCVHGNHKTHGKTHTRLYSIYNNMINRCKNPNVDCYKYYGGKGISICEEWEKDFQKFYNWAMGNGYEENLTIDRIDVNGNYEPDNCQWVTMKEQANNTTRNRIIKYNGESKTLKQWAEILGFDESVLRNRLNRGWSVERAIETPKMIQKAHIRRVR